MQFLDLLNSLRSSLARLRSSTTSFLLEGKSKCDKRVTLYLPNSLRKENIFLHHLLSMDAQFYFNRRSCSLLHHFTKLFWILENNEEYDTQFRTAVAMDTVPEYILFRNDEDLLFPLTFIPQHLQNLYRQLFKKGFITINSKDSIVDDRQCLCYGHILLECLMVISNTSCKRLSVLTALKSLLPCLRMHQLENFASSLFWIFATKDSIYLSDFEAARQVPFDYETGLYINRVEYFYFGDDITDEERRTVIEKSIEQEHQRLGDAFTQNDQTTMKIYSASISLARISRWTHHDNRLHLLEQCVQGAMSIKNKLIRLDALCMIAFYSHSDYNQIEVNQRRSLQKEIEYQLQDVYPDLPLLLHTAILIRCLPLFHDQKIIDQCLQNLLRKFNDAEQEDQQVVYEALVPYFGSIFAFSSVLKSISNSSLDHKKSSILMEYFTKDLSNSILISNLYLVELTSDLQRSIADDDLHLLVSQLDFCTNDQSTAYEPFQLECSILTTAQALTITNILTSVSALNCSQKSRQICIDLNKTLHRFNIVEFKACRLLESWMKWKDSNELFLFAYHAALLLTNSDFWSVESVLILCDLLCCEHDRFRQRAEIILRAETNDNDIRTSSKLGLDVLLALGQRKAYYQHTSPSANVTLTRTCEDITIDVPSHLEALLWLERYRVHALANKEYFFNNRRLLPISHVASYLPNDITIDVSVCDIIFRISKDLGPYICDLIKSNFSTFLPLEDDTKSNAVLESHSDFVASVLIHLIAVFENINYARQLIIDALIILLKTSRNNRIRRVAAFTLDFVCVSNTSRSLFDQLQTMVNNEINEPEHFSDVVLSALISSYSHCASVCDFKFDQDAMNLFRKLLKHSSRTVVKAVHTGLGRVLKNSSLLFEMLDSDYIQCYHALMGSTAYISMYKAYDISTEAVVDFIEKHPDLLSIFIVELYQSIRHLNNTVQHIKTTDYYLAYGYPEYVRVAELIAVRMPAAFCAFIKDWWDGDNLKRALFYASKQHNHIQRAACLTILSIFGELTMELCQMIVEALRDDPHLQNTCYKSLTRITSIKDEKIVLNLLFAYLKSKSMNVRYVTAKLLLHLSQSSLISFDQVQTVLFDAMLEPNSNEDLWLIEEQDDVRAECIYYYAGPLKDVIYSLLVCHLTGDESKIIRRNELNDIDANFTESETAARLASCLYEKKVEENLPVINPTYVKSID
jgi:hypothetical protein